MKNTMNKTVVLALFFTGALHSVSAEGDFTDRIKVHTRIGYFIEADVEYGVDTVSPSYGTTPDGDAYNYEDGYVLTGPNGDSGGVTWYWGYDDASQVVGDTIQMTRSTYAASGDTYDMGASHEFPGIELVYSHEVQEKEGRFFGFDIGGSYQPLRFNQRGSYVPTVTTVTDEFAFTSGTTPPDAPYQGSYDGPGFVISSTPNTISSVTTPGAPVSVSSELHGSLWGLHIGPYMDAPINDRFFIHASGGLSLALLDATFKWNNGGTAPSSGRDQDYEFLGGAYMAGNLNWYANETWILSAGVRFEYLKSYEKNFDGNRLELDLNHMVYWTFGVGRDF